MIGAVVAYRSDGLGSRLMAFGNGLRVARALGVPCYFAWDQGGSAGGITHLRALLDVTTMEPEVKVETLSRVLREIRPLRIGFDAGKRIIERAAIDEMDILLCGVHRIQRIRGEEESPDLHEGLAAAIRYAAPAPALAARIRDFAARHDLGAAVGVHVRRGDLVGHAKDVHRVRLIELDRYFAVLDVVARDEPLFLCTEDASVIEAFSMRYPGRVFRHPTSSFARDDGTAVREALIEMILLSETRFIVAGPSAFSRYAAARTIRPLIVLENRHTLEESLDIAKAAIAPALAEATPPVTRQSPR